MGEEINSLSFSDEDFKEFSNRVQNETNVLRSWLKDDAFDNDHQNFGFELECCLIDKDNIPTPLNKEFISATSNENIVPELSKFNFEINSLPHSLNPHLLKNMHDELNSCWSDVTKAANELSCKAIMTGILPTLRDNMLTDDNMSPLNRYFALTDQVLKRRKGEPITIDIEGKDNLHIEHYDLMLEAAATSLQIHVQVKSCEAKRFFNASKILSAPMVALGANSPFLYGKELWQETRIPLFEQAVNIGPDSPQLVTFGQGYVKESLIELFEENLRDYPVLLPILFDSKPEELRHLKLLNGTVWRWNRPIIGFNSDGTPHQRIEHRALAAGPSIPDVIANCAFFIGALFEMARSEETPEELLPYDKAQDNFYQCSKRGLEADVTWLDGKRHEVQSLIFHQLLPKARAGLTHLGLDGAEIEYYLDEIIKNRVLTGMTGAAWQRSFIDTHGAYFQDLLGAYFNNQSKNIPVHQWSV